MAICSKCLKEVEINQLHYTICRGNKYFYKYCTNCKYKQERARFVTRKKIESKPLSWHDECTIHYSLFARLISGVNVAEVFNMQD